MDGPNDHAAASRQETKVVVRRAMRELRRALPGVAARSVAIWVRVTALAEVRAARSVLAFASIAGEPDTGPFVQWCREGGKELAFPEDERLPDPATFDLVVVPGVAFTPAGERLGQGGGWYDRLLPELRPGCLTVGVAFDIQLLPELPTERHDVGVQCVVTETRTLRPGHHPPVGQTSS